MFCANCGEENRNDRKFCSNCGSPLRDYTKPRENLLMPEDVKNANIEAEKVQKKRTMLNIAMTILFLLAVTCIVVDFFVPNKLQMLFAIISLVFCVAFFVLWGVKRNIRKQYNSKDVN